MLKFYPKQLKVHLSYTFNHHDPYVAPHLMHNTVILYRCLFQSCPVRLFKAKEDKYCNLFSFCHLGVFEVFVPIFSSLQEF